ncbi:hypothetical protein L4X63_08745 [Geomonas sp. Red32]|uniref:hypothetical protein n=1 Tax=Geomonas sp. Red32 TaxID=2912856 RepID=UPI00202CCE33|nr:hypothetical protein [Geomonas sp. Red32]MCM0081673.1 hypothetical protein [Geomonas sp. Red32]
MRIPRFTIYSRETGVEIAAAEKRQQGKPAEGRVSLRFFRLASGSHQIRFLAEPWEAFELARKVAVVHAAAGKESLTHKFDAGEGETVTKLSVEGYERNGKKGFAFSIQRGEEAINVPAPAGEFLFAAEFLKHLALVQSWSEQGEQNTGRRVHHGEQDPASQH